MTYIWDHTSLLSDCQPSVTDVAGAKRHIPDSRKSILRTLAAVRIPDSYRKYSYRNRNCRARWRRCLGCLRVSYMRGFSLVAFSSSFPNSLHLILVYQTTQISLVYSYSKKHKTWGGGGTNFATKKWEKQVRWCRFVLMGCGRQPNNGVSRIMVLRASCIVYHEPCPYPNNATAGARCTRQTQMLV